MRAAFASSSVPRPAVCHRRDVHNLERAVFKLAGARLPGAALWRVCVCEAAVRGAR